VTYRYQFRVSLMSLFSPYWKCPETRFRAKSTSGETSSSQGSQSAVPLQARNPACKPPHLPAHGLHPGDKAALAESALQNTAFCSEEFKIKILKLRHQKGRLTTSLPAWNECDSLLLLACKTATQNLVGYKTWPKKPKLPVWVYVLFLSVSPEVRSALTIIL